MICIFLIDNVYYNLYESTPHKSLYVVVKNNVTDVEVGSTPVVQDNYY